MSGTRRTPVASQSGTRRTPAGFAGDLGLALRAEWTKLRTTPGTAWLLLGVIAATVAIGVLAADSPGCPGGPCRPDQVRLSLSGVGLGQAVVAVLAVLTIGTEYSTGLIRVSLAAMPRRTTMLVAKCVALAVPVATAAALAVAGSLMFGLSTVDKTAWRPAIGSVLYLVLIGLLSVGIGTAVRNAAAAVGIVLGLLYLFPVLSLAMTDPDWQRKLEQIGPMSAGLSVQATIELDQLAIGPWAGLGVLAAWAAGALLLGGVVLARRDA